MQILRAHQQPVILWKNGGGRTRSVAIAPEGAGLDAFDWRISVAEVAADGPFSAFPDVDRTLVLLSGDGMELVSSDGSVVLARPGDRWDFPGELPVQAALLGGPTIDLNLMVRRGRSDARLDVVRADQAVLDGVIVVIDGDVRAGDERLRVGDAVSGRAFRLQGDGRIGWVHGSSVI
ncbi:MAG: HutD family protein [Alphaproteobacteria bacterium]|nr:HutD family protein [Alphaproteobacteria bacterium]